MKKLNIKKLTLTALFAAVAVVGSLFSFPVFGAKCAPVQHLVNILCAVLVGPWWGLAAAFIAALIRNLLALGSPLAFPGSLACRTFVSVWKEASVGIFRRSIRDGNHRRTAFLPGCIICNGQHSRSAFYLRCSVFDQYLWRNDHRDHRDCAAEEVRHACKDAGSVAVENRSA